MSTSGMSIDKNKPSILLMHGSGLTHIVWSLHEQFYSANGFNVLSVDLPGHGESEGPSLKSIESISDWVKSLINVLDLSKISFMGHSQGTLVGIDFASRYPELIDKLVLVAGSNKMPVHPDLINLANNGDSDAVKLMMKWGYEGSKKFIGGNPVEKIILSPRDIKEILAVDLVACNNYSNGSDAAKLIECPTLLIFGSLDKMVNLEAGKKFSSLVKNSKTHIIEGCGHMIMIEKAFEMREKVLEFLK